MEIDGRSEEVMNTGVMNHSQRWKGAVMGTGRCRDRLRSRPHHLMGK